MSGVEIKGHAISLYNSQEAERRKREKNFGTFFNGHKVHESEPGADLTRGTLVSSPDLPAQVFLGFRDPRTGIIPSLYFDFQDSTTPENGSNSLQAGARIRPVKHEIELPNGINGEASGLGCKGVAFDSSLYLAYKNKVFKVCLDSLRGNNGTGEKLKAELIYTMPGTITSLHADKDGALVWGAVSEEDSNNRRSSVVGVNESIIARGQDDVRHSKLVLAVPDDKGNIVASGLQRGGVTIIDRDTRRSKPIEFKARGEIDRILSCTDADGDKAVILQNPDDSSLVVVNPGGTLRAPLRLPFTAVTALSLEEGNVLFGGRNDSVGIADIKDGRDLGSRTLSHMVFTNSKIGGLTQAGEKVFALSERDSRVYSLPLK